MFFMKTVEALIKHRILKSLIRACTVGQQPLYGSSTSKFISMMTLDLYIALGTPVLQSLFEYDPRLTLCFCGKVKLVWHTFVLENRKHYILHC